MKDKERIRAFCDDLAKQWEENCPELGAYQVIVNLYRRLRTFLLFNDEVHNMFLLWEMQRYFGTEMRKKAHRKTASVISSPYAGRVSQRICRVMQIPLL